MATARELRLKALEIHRELLEHYEMPEVREIIRNLVAIETALYTGTGDEEDADLRDHIRPVGET
jgi:hypothetical protein